LNKFAKTANTGLARKEVTKNARADGNASRDLHAKYTHKKKVNTRKGR